MFLTDVVKVEVFSDKFVESGIAIVNNHEIVRVFLRENWIKEIFKTKLSHSLR